jgi:tetratricopeptide (TPR) repeat protein
VQQVHDRLDEAQAALGRASALLPPEAPLRPLLDFRRGLIAQLLLGDPVSARAAYRRAHAGAEQQQDLLLLSYTWRHLASIAQQDGNLAGARHGFAESLRLREETGFTVGIAPALTALADVSPAPEAAQLRAEAARLVRALGGLPFWLDVSSTG